ncbi:MAG: DUF402 domain-containing protein [Chloroflexota bacterium]|nr:DUF402 domain-containing protein [Chloroflexota bacterium]MDE2942200.1 DUF402 domain-containing protein [Chloroflexota bacterium]MDE3267499.1 DUF402 domain-containing protein [Chloroflexota bacterium]
MNKSKGGWQPGTQILQQDMWGDQLLTVRPVTVVEDGEQYLALYTHPSAPYRSAATRSRHAMSVRDRIDHWEQPVQTPLEERVSGPYHVLTLTPPGSWHSVWLFWDLDWEVHRWFVNLQSPIRRTSKGIVVRDHILDIRVEPDLSWSWKDRDEFDELVRRGWFTDKEYTAVLAEAQAMARIVTEKGPPFSDDWELWRPDPSWPVPVMPDDWDQPGW